MLLMVGDPDDLTLAYISWLAEGRGLACRTLDEREYGVSWWGRHDEAAGPPALRDEDGGIPCAGAFVRLNPDPGIPRGWELGDRAAELLVSERRATLSHLLDRLPARVVNRPGAGRSNGTKPLHMAELSAAGFDVPEWIAGNDAGAAAGFLGAHPEGAVVKSVSGLRSHVRLAGGDLIERLRAGTSPVVVQRRIQGFEVRVHVVGDRVFGSRVDAEAVDYRFDERDVAYAPWDVPAPVAALCRAHAWSSGLALAGLDFRIDPDGRWWCLEMNPVPTFLPYEAATGHPIGDAVIDHLVGDARATARRSPLHALPGSG